MRNSPVTIQLDAESFGLGPWTLGELVQRISAYDVADALDFLSRINVIVSVGDFDMAKQRGLVKALLSPKLTEEGIRRGVLAGSAVVFARLQIIRAIELVALFAGCGERKIETDEDHYEFGEILLQVEAVYNRLKTPIEVDLDLEAGLNPIEHPSRLFIRFMQSRIESLPLSEKYEMARGYLMLSKFLPEFLKDKMARVSSSFEARHGITLSEAWFACFGLYTVCANQIINQVPLPTARVDTQEFFRLFNWSPESIARVTDRLSMTLPELQAIKYSEGLERRAWGFQYPLLQLDGIHLLLDPRSLLRLIGGEVLEWAFAEQSAELRKIHSDALGDAFEKYCRYIAFEACACFPVDPKPRVLPQKAKDIDVRILDRNITVLIEIKHNKVRFPDLSGLTPQQRANDLNAPNVFWRKAINQLARETKLWLESRKHADRLHAVMVVNDESYADFGIQDFMNSHYEEELALTAAQLRKMLVGRLSVMTLSEWEYFIGLVTGGMFPADILDANTAEDPQGKACFMLAMHRRNYSYAGNPKFLAGALDDMMSAARNQLSGDE